MKQSSIEMNKLDIRKTKKIKEISRGGFGVVYEAEEIETRNLYAAKFIFCKDDEAQFNKLIDREVKTMMRIQHPTIIKFVGYSPTDFDNARNILIFMELAPNGSLYEVIKNITKSIGPKDYTNTTRQIILVGVSRGMKYLHDHNIIHRDLKPGNILLNSEYQPLITDFGMSKFFDTGHSYSQSQFGGTKPYQAPEILLGDPYNIKVDVYAFGIMMFEVLTDSFAYPELLNGSITDFKFQNNVINNNYRPKFTFPIKKTLQELIIQCWSHNPEDRPSFDEIFEKLCNDDYLLDDVDIDELRSYITDINDPTDTMEELLGKIKKIENDMKKLKKQNEEEIKKKDQEIEELKKVNQQIREQYEKAKNLNEKKEISLSTIQQEKKKS